MDKNQRFVTTRFLCIAAVGGCALLTICPTRSINGGELTEAQRANTGEPAKMEISPAELVGLDEQQTTELLGPATTTESRAPASVWHYKNSRCELELVFYMEMRTGLMRSLHYNFKNGDGTAAQRQGCLTAILQARSNGAPGDDAEKIMATEAPINEVHPDPVEHLADNDIPRGSQAKQQAARPRPRVQRGYARYRPRGNAAQADGWNFTFALRNYSGRSSADAALTTGWGGGQFGPSPYSSSGQ